MSRLKKLPEPVKDFYKEVENHVRSVLGEKETVKQVAWELTKQNYTPPKTAKSVAAMPSSVTESGSEYKIDVKLGEPEYDQDGDYLNFWQNKPQHPIVGDMEHIHYYRNANEYYDGDLKDFVLYADNFRHENGALYAEVTVPNHKYTPEFMRRWNAGELGASIEYEFPPHAVKHTIKDDGKVVREIQDGIITGFSITEEPSLKSTKMKNDN